MRRLFLALLFTVSLSLYAQSPQLTGETIGNNKGWTGIDLGTPHIIDQVSWIPNASSIERSVRLGVFEGANEPDFSDGVPLYLIDEDGIMGETQSADITVTRPFRYVRYISPSSYKSKIAQVAFFGHETTDSIGEELLYQPTNLPCVVVHVEGEQTPVDKVNDLVASFSIISDGGRKELHEPGTFRLRGNASIDFEKKPYRIKFEKKQNVLNAPAKAKKWTLIASYGDKTLMRNIVGFELSRRFGQAYTPYIQPVDLFVNGEYKGCYQLCDQVEAGKGRLEIEEMEASDVTGGYLIEVDAYADREAPDSWFKSSNGNPVTIKSPDDDKINIKQKNYIMRDFKQLETLLFGNDFDNETEGYRKMFDLTSFLNHFLIGELNGNTDTYWSLYMYKPRDGELIYTGPVWDLDLAFDNDNRTYPIDNLRDWIYATKGSIAGNFRKFVSRIVKDDKRAIADLKTIWADARHNRNINAESLHAFIDQLAEELEASQQLNFKRWNIMNRTVHQNPKIWGSYAAEVENIKNYISKRIKKMDTWLSYDPSSVDELTSPQEKQITGIYTIHGIPVTAPQTGNTYLYKYSDGSSEIVYLNF